MPALRAAGFDVKELASTTGAYPPASQIARPFWLATNVAENLLRVLRARAHDLCFLQRYLTSTLCTWEPLLGKPFVFDVDDAIFLGKRGWNADRIARSASMIICGNDFLANHFSRYGRVTVVPTAVDTARYAPPTQPFGGRPSIGWSGSSSGLRYVYAIEDALADVLALHPDAILRIVSDRAPRFAKIAADRVVFEPWSAQREIAVLHEFTVGIMPLDDTPWARGKCAFKMLTYMAAGLPVVVSPTGMNADVLALGECGLAARSQDDWRDTLSVLLRDAELRRRYGHTGRRIVEQRYALDIVAPQLASVLTALLEEMA